ncbi:MAG: hypothetical protein M0P12_02085 [Paludibacteraceae bacterium]|nr:hypothetical protein [Paludibacteraceae bacterium]
MEKRIDRVNKIKKKYLGLGLLFIVVIGLLYLYFNIPVRTSIFRRIAPSSTYLLCDNDTIYNFGYFGVKKYVHTKTGEVEAVAENNDFIHNCLVGYLIGRSGAISGNYLYVAARSYLGGIYKSNEKGYLKGKLLIMNRYDLHVIREYESDYSMIETDIYDKIMVVGGLQGFNIYDIDNPIRPKIVYTFRSEKALEFQGGDFFEANGRLYYAFARFSNGISIYDITKPDSTFLVKNIELRELDENIDKKYGLQCFRLVSDYPYLYATLGPVKESLGSFLDKRGLMVIDVSNMDSLVFYTSLVPKEKYYTTVTGDPQPSHIAITKNKIYLNFAEKGIAVFSKPTDRRTSHFIDFLNINEGNMILPICTNGEYLFAGSNNSSHIYTYKIP